MWYHPHIGSNPKLCNLDLCGIYLILNQKCLHGVHQINLGHQPYGCDLWIDRSIQQPCFKKISVLAIFILLAHE